MRRDASSKVEGWRKKHSGCSDGSGLELCQLSVVSLLLTALVEDHVCPLSNNGVFFWCVRTCVVRIYPCVHLSVPLPTGNQTKSFALSKCRPRPQAAQPEAGLAQGWSDLTRGLILPHGPSITVSKCLSVEMARAVREKDVV